MLQLHLSYQQFYCLLRRDLYYRFYGNFNCLRQWDMLSRVKCWKILSQDYNKNWAHLMGYIVASYLFSNLQSRRDSGEIIVYLPVLSSNAKQRLVLLSCFLCSPWGSYSIWNPVNSLWPSDTIWRQRSGSTLAQVMACCLTAPSHYLNQCWLIISKVLWHSSEGIIIRRSEDTNQ